MAHDEVDNRPCCPKCQSRSVKVDNEKGFFDFLYTLVMQRPVKCRKCRHRFGAFYDPTSQPTVERESRISRRQDRSRQFVRAVDAGTLPGTAEAVPAA